jgi:NitT/TauT family transport system permease protein
MDVILPYVVWITLLAWLTDFGLRQLSRHVFPWFHAQTGGGAA